MSSRRVPLSSNPNVANSPLRGASALAPSAYAKPKRSYATLQREEPYGQPPPVKKQALDCGGASLRHSCSPPKPSARSQPAQNRAASRSTPKERSSRLTKAEQEFEEQKIIWRQHYRAKFPLMVFYFENIPDEIRAKLTKKVNFFGARQEPFFSIEVTHVVTSRALPSDKNPDLDADTTPLQVAQQDLDDQPQTINPSLLDRNPAARRKLFLDLRQASLPANQLDDPAKRYKNTRSNDVLHKAREMGKKIWTLEKFQAMLAVLFEGVDTDQGRYAFRPSQARASHYGLSKQSHEPDLHQLLHNERINGPSDRDPAAVTRDLVYFKGPFIYIWDMDEKHKPIMVREYLKVTSKTDGEWPQFRSVANGRCPFIEEIELPPERHHARLRERCRTRATRRDEAMPVSKSLTAPSVSNPASHQRPLAEVEAAAAASTANRMQSAASQTEVLNPAKAALSKQVEMRPHQNAFTSRAEPARLFTAEPLASGLQPSAITSAIRSQMISSTSGIHGAKAATSKEVHGLQRKVLQKANPASHEASSRRPTEVSMEVASSRSTNMGRLTSKTLQAHDDESQRTTGGRDRKSRSQALKSKKDLKPGYCENCQDKFRDFDEHIVSRKHRKFAENDANWVDLDRLLTQLRRQPKYTDRNSDDEADEEAW